MWSLECGEVLTAEALTEKFKSEGVEIYFPLHDIGTDLLAVKGKNHVYPFNLKKADTSSIEK
jgi:hypothetical protein